ncbi:MAG: hypothetical protein CMO80_24055 [Verrucomicrobiales bacterium]|mgnify:CR=1 FL=1|nr:hypothetical protein [Verrucomicrobiales bacterium]|tara:strand:- start:5710 stop:6306 length:597 start_codon:yes stop_codon:yes gene_type:complete
MEIHDKTFKGQVILTSYLFEEQVLKFVNCVFTGGALGIKPRTPGKRLIVQHIIADNHFVPSYSHFGRMDYFRPQASVPDYLTADLMEVNRLIMADHLEYWWVNRGWTYSHGKRGPAESWPTYRWFKDFGEKPRMEVQYRLFGDGHVDAQMTHTWKPAAPPTGHPNSGGRQGDGARSTFSRLDRSGLECRRIRDETPPS